MRQDSISIKNYFIGRDHKVYSALERLAVIYDCVIKNLI